MTTIQQVCKFLDNFAPTRLAEDWDNVGLLVGDPNLSAKKIMTCLTVTPESANEAVENNVDMIVSHHPLPFRPIKKITTEKTPTRLLWQLIRNGTAIYSPHTGFDSAVSGINQSVCETVGIENTQPLQPFVDDPDSLGAGRFGDYPTSTCEDFVAHLKQVYQLPNIRFVAAEDIPINRVGTACGSGGSFLPAAAKAKCNALITGEADFHSCLEAKALGINLLLLGHYASERFAVEMLADRIREEFNDLEIWASRQESDPIGWA
jgi:dinuclear metal center YbgI/SA1388 family protein